MADNDQKNDEYEFSDLDALNPDTLEVDSDDEPASEGQTQHSVMEYTNLKRNVLIVIAVFIVAVVIYKLLSAYFSDQGTKPKPKAPKQQTVVQPQKAPPTQIQAKQAAQTQVPTSPVSKKTEQKISALELTQHNMRSEVENVANQLSSINTNLNQLTSSVDRFGTLLTQLSDKLESQSRNINRLIASNRAKTRKHEVRKHASRPRTMYYIQAVIPGRAWLISNNGTTLTVSEGSKVPGYGTVKLIDPQQGRITLSSGQVIKFNQNDS